MDCRIHSAQINEIIKQRRRNKEPLWFSCIHFVLFHLTLDRYHHWNRAASFFHQILMKNNPNRRNSQRPNRYSVRIFQGNELIVRI